ncbi:MAG: hypothetical protein K2X81_23210, partial [Candidatus Obscuribacterales bacterium]|nr:hypothetical protein [Candidatus Obscuribacterales bacterium]MBY0431885.1 hypothetical protein [Rhodospirillales bacterium]
MTPQRYFTALLGHSRDIVARLPLSAEPQPIGQCLPRLKSAVAAMEAAETERLAALPRPRPQAENGRARGMNTVGILADRLTILVMKDWALRHR